LLATAQEQNLPSTETNRNNVLGRKRGKYETISVQLCEHFIAYVQNNDTCVSKAAKIFGIKKSTAQSIWKKYIKTKDACPSPRGGATSTKITEELKQLITLLVDTDSDMT
jgi:transposase